MQSNELYIGNLDRNVNAEELKKIFQVYGNVIRSEVKISDQTHNASYGFVGFQSAADAQLAKEQANGIILHSRRMIVQCSKSKPRENRRRYRSIGLDHGKSHRRDRSRSRSSDRRSTSSSSSSRKDRKRNHRSRISSKDTQHRRRHSSDRRTTRKD